MNQRQGSDAETRLMGLWGNGQGKGASVSKVECNTEMMGVLPFHEESVYLMTHASSSSEVCRDVAEQKKPSNLGLRQQLEPLDPFETHQFLSLRIVKSECVRNDDFVVSRND